jgi:RluA family pseudouridine synthase
VPGRAGEPGLIQVLRDARVVHRDDVLRMVHRLDRDASGVIVLACTLEAQRHLVEQFRTRRVEKVYVALVRGFVPSDGVIDMPIAVDRNRMTARVGGPGAKPAVTRYRVVQRVAGHTLLECHPVTGRMHQIRLHLAGIGHPLAVDPVYAGGEALWLSRHKPDYRPNRSGSERPLIARLSLHALSLTVEHPTGSGRITMEAPMPKDLRAALRQLARL